MKINIGLTSSHSLTEVSIIENTVTEQNILQPLYPKPKIWGVLEET